MGDRWRPKSGGAVSATEQGDSPLDQFGRGEKDPVTGLYEWYDYGTQQVTASGVGWSELIAEWRLIDIDFAKTYGVDLDDNLHRPFRWFAARVAGLLSFPDTLLRARFRDDEPTSEGDML